MQIFIDESGDTGLKKQSSSDFFILAAIVFASDEEAARCARGIEKLKQDLCLPSDFEFHFAHNSKRQRNAFLQIICQYDFVYHYVFIDKDKFRAAGLNILGKNEVYKLVYRSLFSNIGQYITAANVYVDNCGNTQFRNEIRQSITSVCHPGSIRKLRQADSETVVLIQVADYVAGAVNKKLHSQSINTCSLENHERVIVTIPSDDVKKKALAS